MKKSLLPLLLLLAGAAPAVMAQVANDSCQVAITVTPDGVCANGTTVGAADDLPNAVGCQPGGMVLPDVWYSFVASNPAHVISVDAGVGAGGITGNIGLIVADGSCGNLTILATECSAGSLVKQVSGLVNGQTYYYAVWSESGANQGSFTTCVTSALPPTSPSFDCPNAITLLNTGSVYVPNGMGGLGMQEVNLTNSGCFASGENNSRWFKFSAGTAGQLIFKITPNGVTGCSGGADYDWALWDITADPLNCTEPAGGGLLSATALACNWSGASGPTGMGFTGCNPGAFAPSITTSPGHTYALLIDRYTAASTLGFHLMFDSTGGFSPRLGSDASFSLLATPTPCGEYQFTKTAQVTPDTNSSYLWSFGDGATSSAQNPAHTYSTSGTYMVTLEVTDMIGIQRTSSQTITVTTDTPLPPSVSGPATLCSGETLSLNATGSGAAIYSWSGPNNFQATGAAISISAVTSSHAGTYSVVATNNSCNTQPVVVPVTVQAAPVAGFTYQLTACNCGVDITNTALAMQQYLYDFGDGSPVDSTENPSHQYAVPGTYTITQTVVDANGCTATSTQTVSIISATANLLDLQARVYPNPATGKVTVDLSGIAASGAAEVTIFNLPGQVLQRATIPTGAVTELPLKNVASGLYLLEIRADGKRRIQQLQIQE